MNSFEIAATALLAGFVPCGLVCVRGRAIDAVVALQLAGSLLVLALICLAEGFHRSSYYDVPVIAALVVWISGLIFARFVGRFI